MFIQHFLSFSHLSDHSHNIMNIWNDKVVLDKTNSPQYLQALATGASRYTTF